MAPFVEQEFLPSIPNDTSIERIGQIQKLYFQRTFSTGVTKNTIANPEKKASWTPLLTATDGTKVSVTPYISEPTNEAGEARTYGGGNATLNGIAIRLGRGAAPFKAKLLEIKQGVVKELKKLEGETLSVITVNEYGKLIMKKDGADYMGFPIRQLYIGDKKLGGYEEVDANMIEFSFNPSWSDDLVIVDPDDFDPLTDLENPTGSD